MSNEVVFFGLGNKDGNSLPSWRRFSKSGEGEVAFHIDGGVRIESGDEVSKKTVLNQVREQLDKSAGMIFDIDPSIMTKVRVYCKDPKKVSAPKKVLFLTLAGQCRWEDLGNDKELQCQAWECLIIPATGSFEKTLSAFVKSLDDLPDDYRVSVLLNLVLPTFESRMARLEHLADVRKTIREAGSVRERVEQAIQSERIGFWDLMIWPAAFAVLLGVVGWLYLSTNVVWEIQSIRRQIDDLRARSAAEREVDSRPSEETAKSPKASNFPPAEAVKLQGLDIDLADRTGTVTLSRPASQLTLVNITSNDMDALEVQPTLSIEPGGRSGRFTVVPGPVTRRTVVTVRAQHGGTTLQRDVAVQPPRPGADP